MSRTQKIMMSLRVAMERLLPAIKRATYNTEVVIEPSGVGFRVVATWPIEGGMGQHTSEFTVARVLGSYLQAVQPMPCRSPCAFRQELVREILNARLGRVY